MTRRLRSCSSRVGDCSCTSDIALAGVGGNVDGKAEDTDEESAFCLSPPKGGGAGNECRNTDVTMLMEGSSSKPLGERLSSTARMALSPATLRYAKVQRTLMSASWRARCSSHRAVSPANAFSNALTKRDGWEGTDAMAATAMTIGSTH